MSDAQRIIAAFGGIRPMAKKLGVAVTTVQGWKERDAIPVARLTQVRDAAQREGIDLSDEALARIDLGAPEKESTADGAERVRAEKVERPVEAGIREAEAETESPVIDAVPERRTGGLARPILFGLAFGLACAAGVAGAWLYGLYGPASTGTSNPALAGRLEAAEKQVAVLRAKIAETDKLTGALTALQSAVADVNRRVDALPTTSAGAAALATTVKDLAGKLAALETRLAQAGPGAPGATKTNADAIKALTAENQALSQALKAAEERRATQAKTLAAQLAALEEKLKQAGPGTSGPAASANSDAIGKLQGANDELRAALKKAQDRIASLEADRGRAATGRLETGALVIAIGQLREAASTGSGFAQALAPIKTMTADVQDVALPIATLEKFAKTGVPTMPQLRDRFERLAVAIVRAGRRPESGDWLDRAWARARSVVIVRRTGGDVAGDTPEAIVARSEATLAKGDLASAVKLLGGLKGTAAQAAAGWLTEARNRVAVDAALRALNKKAIALVAGSAEKKQP